VGFCVKNRAEDETGGSGPNPQTRRHDRRGIEAQEQPRDARTLNRRRAVDNAATLPRKIAFEHGDVVVPETFQRPRIRRLFVQGTLGMRHRNPLGRRPAIGGHKACFDGVAMKLPARVMTDALQPDIDTAGPRDVGKRADEATDVLGEQIAHLSRGHPALIEQRLQRRAKVAGLNENSNSGEFGNLCLIQPLAQPNGKRALPDHEFRRSLIDGG